MENEIVLFETKDNEIKLSVPVMDDTVWLSRSQMAELFGRDVKTIGKHIGNTLKEELDSSTVAKFATVQNEGGREVERNIEYYNLEMIISVGYRVKSQRGIEFRRWANKVLKDYIIKGYALNDKRLQALQKTVEIQTKMLANTMDIEQEDVLKAVNMYTQALTLLDQYDHLGGSVMDAAGDFYSNAYRKYLLFRNWGIGLIIPGGILLIIYMFVLKKR